MNILLVFDPLFNLIKQVIQKEVINFFFFVCLHDIIVLRIKVGVKMNNRIINNIKSLAIDMLDSSHSKCPKMSLQAATVFYTLYAKNLRISTSDSKWMNRDRFVLSDGNYTTLLYATLFMAGYNIQLEDLKTYTHMDSILSDYPEVGRTPGIDLTTGNLAHGLAQAIGMAVAETKLEKQYTYGPKAEKLLDYHVYVVCSSDELMRGLSQEALAWAGIQQFTNLVILSLSMSSKDKGLKYMDQNMRDRMEAMGFECFLIKDGENMKAIDHSIKKAKNSKRPAFIEIRIEEDEFTSLQGQELTNNVLEELKKQLNVPIQSFYVDEDAKRAFHEELATRVNVYYSKWALQYQEYIQQVHQGDFSQCDFSQTHFSPVTLLNRTFAFTNEKESLTKMNARIMEEIVPMASHWVGAISTDDFSLLPHQKFYSTQIPENNLLVFGDRVQAMGSICNGLASCSFRTFCLANEVDADDMKASIRMSCLMNVPVTYIFACNSIRSGKDFPYSSVEQLAMLRSIPNLSIYRPADAREIIGCWDTIFKENKPCAFILGQNEVDILPTTDASEVAKGAYIVKKEEEKLHGILLATGTEVQLAYHLSIDLYQKEHLNLRVVSMPSMDHFLAQSESYQEEILPTGIRTIVIEAASLFGWEQFVYNKKYCITVSSFSKMGSKDERVAKEGFDYPKIMERIIDLMK